MCPKPVVRLNLIVSKNTNKPKKIKFEKKKKKFCKKQIQNITQSIFFLDSIYFLFQYVESFCLGKFCSTRDISLKRAHIFQHVISFEAIGQPHFCPKTTLFECLGA